MTIHAYTSITANCPSGKHQNREDNGFSIVTLPSDTSASVFYVNNGWMQHCNIKSVACLCGHGVAKDFIIESLGRTQK